MIGLLNTPKVARPDGLPTVPLQLRWSQGVPAVDAAPLKPVPAFTEVHALPVAPTPRFSARSAHPVLPMPGALRVTVNTGAVPATASADSQAARLLGRAAVPVGKVQANWFAAMLVQLSALFSCQPLFQY